MKKYLSTILMLLLFFGIGIFFSLRSGSWFFLFNFGYIGTSVAIGFFLNAILTKKKKPWARRTSQLLIGLYMFVFLGVIAGENMQLEGFFWLLLSGIFMAAVIHYFVAKLAGPLVFGRAWCGWACWTAMLLDLLPFKKPANPRIQKLGLLRYLHFLLSLGLVIFLFKGLQVQMHQLSWFLAGNLLYYLIAFILAFVLKDNRAFCKYVCPIPAVQKILSRFSLMKIKINPQTCTNCRLCEINCPMNVKLLAYKDKGQRVLSTECILCYTCLQLCPHKAITNTIGFDSGIKEEINKK